jgi:hypothetical protein
LADKVHKKEGKKRDYCRHFEGFEEYFCYFNLKPEGAAVGFPYTTVIRNGNSQDYGKNERKGYADRQGEEQDFTFRAQFHRDIIYVFRLFYQ